MKLGILILSVFLSAISHADEGLYSTKPNPPLAMAWDATVGLLGQSSKGSGWGSGVIVKVQPVTKNQNQLTILTVSHNFGGLIALLGDKETMEKETIIFSQISTEMQSDGRAKIRMDQLSTGFQVLDVDGEHDLGLISVLVEKGSGPYQTIQWDSCPASDDKTIYSTGFPNIMGRAPSTPEYLPDPLNLTKRWSQGFFLGAQSDGFEITNLDGAAGVSGAPVVGSGGNLVGLYRGALGANIPSDIYPSGGTLITGCRATLDFLKRNHL